MMKEIDISRLEGGQGHSSAHRHKLEKFLGSHMIVVTSIEL